MRGDGRVFPRGQIFWCAYNLRGKEFRESCETREKTLGIFAPRSLPLRMLTPTLRTA